MVNKRVQNAVLGCNLKNDRMISVRFQGKPFTITVIQAYSPTSNTEEAEVERFYEDLQDLLELTPTFGEEETETQGKLKLAGFPQSGGRGAPGVAGHAEVRAGALTGLRRTFSSCPALGCARPPSASHGVLPGLPWVGSSGQVRAWL